MTSWEVLVLHPTFLTVSRAAPFFPEPHASCLLVSRVFFLLPPPFYFPERLPRLPRIEERGFPAASSGPRGEECEI